MELLVVAAILAVALMLLVRGMRGHGPVADDPPTLDTRGPDDR